MPSEVRPGISDAFVSNYENLQSVAYSEWPELSAFGAEQILSNLAGNLCRYRRRPDHRFVEWAAAWVRRETRRHRFLTEMFRTNHDMLYKAISESLYRSSGEDLAVELQDYEAEVYTYLLQHPRKLDRLMHPKKAKPRTVLYALTKSRMRGVRSKIGDRHALISRWMVEFLNSPGIPIAEPSEIADEYEKNLYVA